MTLTPHYDSDGITIHAGNCLNILAELPDASVDAVVTDPPYGLEFMGKAWDSFGGSTGMSDGGYLSGVPAAPKPGQAHGFQQWCQQWATECLRILKPGGHILAFGGTRTSHRLACAIEDAGFEIRDSIAWLYGSGFPKSLDVSKAIDKAAGHWRGQAGAVESDNDAMGGPNYERTDKGDPITDDARTWQGWGTALKPGWEIAVAARKPYAASDTLGAIGSRLAILEESCRRHANDAGPDSAPIPADSSAARTGSAPEPAATPPGVEPAKKTATGKAARSSDQTATSASESTDATYSSIVTSWKACWAELCEATNTSTTETTSSTTTDLQTLSSCLSQITPANITTDPTSPDGPSSLARAVDSMFAAAVLNSRATRTLTALESATDSTPTTSPARGALSQVVVARKPLGGTVAANVLAHGTGALNIDACRIETDELRPYSPGVHRDSPSSYNDDNWRGREQIKPAPAGRWPANVALDEDQATALDTMSGESTTPSKVTRGAGGQHGTYSPIGRQDDVPCYGDSGGASRFFYTAKAAADERVRIPKADGEAAMFAGSIRKRCTKCGKQEVNVGTSACACPTPDFQPDKSMSGYIAHPTVKPLALMRWLVRLVTPPGGVVLEPFAGSGTTVEACILEGFRCVAIEREADYLPLIMQRIHRRRDPVQAVKGSGSDGGLFDLLGEETA